MSPFTPFKKIIFKKSRELNQNMAKEEQQQQH
jgi:hypothetical protein